METDEEAISAMLRRDQRSFRTLLITGIAFLLALSLAGAALVYQNTQVAERLSAIDADVIENGSSITQVRLEAHKLRQANDQFVISANRRSLESRADYEDIRTLLQRSAPAGASAADPVAAVVVASEFLAGRRLDLVREMTITNALGAEGAVTDAPTRDLLTAALALSRFDKAGDALQSPDDPKSAATLTPELADARTQLGRAFQSQDLRVAATLGLARLDYILAGANNYKPEFCKRLFDRAGGMKAADRSIQLVIHQAECWRKMGDSARANQEFRNAVARIERERPGADPRPFSGTAADPALQYQAYHGRGTTLIAITAAGSPNEARDLEAARNDLLETARLRRMAGQIDLDVVGSTENIGFTYLRGTDPEETMKHTGELSNVRIQGWNELIRVLAARQTKNRQAEQAALNNVMNFRREEFNECELVKLVGSNYADEALALLKQTRDAGTPPACPSAPAAAAKKG